MPISSNNANERNITDALKISLVPMMAANADMLYVLDIKLRYVCCSRSNAHMLGLDGEQEIIGKTNKELFDRPLAELLDDSCKRILETLVPITDVLQILSSPDGASHYVVASIYPLLDEAGNAAGLFGISRDVTSQKLRDSQLELILNNIPGGLAVYTVDQEGAKLSYFNDGYIRFSGYSREEYELITANDPFALVHSNDRHELLGLLERAKAGESGQEIEGCSFRVRTKDGDYRWMNLSAVLTKQENLPLKLHVVTLDITEQHDYQEKLLLSEERNRLAIEHSGRMIAQFNVAERTLSLPSGFSTSYQLPSQLENVPQEQIAGGRISPDTADAYSEMFEAIAAGGKSGSALFKLSSLRGWRWIKGQYTTIFSSEGTPIVAVISFSDISEELEKEAVYNKWKQSLVQRQDSSYTLLRGNLSKGSGFDSSEGSLIDFFADKPAFGYAELLAHYAQSFVSADDREVFLALLDAKTLLYDYFHSRRTEKLEYRELTDRGVRWLRLSVDLVKYPNSDDIEIYLLFEDIDQQKKAELLSLQRSECDDLTGLLNRQSFTLKLEELIQADEFGALLFIDLDGFKQVNDCFGHAAGDQTLIEMSQKLRRAFGYDDLLCRYGGDEFVVYMNNIKSKTAIRERAELVCALLHKSFSIDVQLSASVGIALCPQDGRTFEELCRKADLAMYHVKGEGKDGCAFYSENMHEREEAPISDPEKDASGSFIYSSPKRRMLIVEDNEINRDYLINLFSDEFIIDTAAEGTAALTKLKRSGTGISVVLLDLMMPGMDGFAVLDQMRASQVMQFIPVIVVSGMNEREASLEAIRHGASDYVTKPVDADLLRLRVASVLSRSENERLLAQNRYLAIQNEEVKRLNEAKQHSEELSIALLAAERADLAKTQFLSSMSHEIRTPLNAVIGYNTLARGELSAAHSDEERRHAEMKVLDFLTKSEVASRQLLSIINDVLDMSAIESGKMKVEAVAFDFKSLITSLTVMFFSQARGKGVNFEVQFDKPTDEWYIGDQLRINQVLTNLLSNAVKFTPERGNVTLHITETSRSDDSANFRFVVSDTGIGMTAEYLNHIWEPFEQAESSISRRFGGSGLGLSITKNLVDLMGGSIRVESVSGGGSIFTVELTLAKTIQPERKASYDFSDINALVVDDDISSCDYIKLLFDRCGAHCMTFTSGRQAVEAFRSALDAGSPFNLCLVDWRMPEMDGFATISEIRRFSERDMPIVVVTAYDFSEVSEQAEKLAINRFISKPLFQSSLFDLLVGVSGRAAASHPEHSPKYDFQGARVLLVEDNNMNMEVGKRILLSAHIEVDCAWNGQEAYDIFTASRAGTYKAILMDVHMPVIDGYQASRMMRSSDHPDAKSIPIIAMTADVFAEDIAEAKSAGMNGHIPKPIDVDNLFQTLEQIMEEK